MDVSSKQNGRPNEHWFWMACGFETLLLMVASLLALLARQQLSATFHWNVRGALLGVAASLPPFLVFVRSLRAQWAPLSESKITKL